MHVPPYDNGRVSGHACCHKKSGTSGGGSGLIFGVPAISGFTSPGFSGIRSTRLLVPSTPLQSGETLMHVYLATLAAASSAQPFILVEQVVPARHPARIHYGIRGMLCQAGNCVRMVFDNAGTVLAGEGRESISMCDAQGWGSGGSEEQVGEG